MTSPRTGKKKKKGGTPKNATDTDDDDGKIKSVHIYLTESQPVHGGHCHLLKKLLDGTAANGSKGKPDRIFLFFSRSVPGKERFGPSADSTVTTLGNWMDDESEAFLAQDMSERGKIFHDVVGNADGKGHQKAAERAAEELIMDDAADDDMNLDELNVKVIFSPNDPSGIDSDEVMPHYTKFFKKASKGMLDEKCDLEDSSESNSTQNFVKALIDWGKDLLAKGEDASAPPESIMEFAAEHQKKDEAAKKDWITYVKSLVSGTGGRPEGSKSLAARGGSEPLYNGEEERKKLENAFFTDESIVQELNASCEDPGDDMLEWFADLKNREGFWAKGASPKEIGLWKKFCLDRQFGQEPGPAKTEAKSEEPAADEAAGGEAAAEDE